MTERAKTGDISADAVMRFLRQHPQFFEHHPNLLKKLHLRHESGDAVSLMERQNQILRQENRQLIDRLNHFIDVAQRNDRLFQKLQGLVLALLPLTDQVSLLQTLQHGLCDQFDVHETLVILFDQANGDGDPWLQIDAQSLVSFFPGLINDGKALCGSFTDAERDMLFAGGRVHSLALAPLLKDQAVIGLIALGHHSPEHFRSGTDTLFLTHLARVTSALLHRL
ncbi:MAG: DUF484 family protein [Saccharospirillum sp.]